MDNLGAGLSLANYDLDIQGAGNLLGDEQSGQIREIGFDLYQKLLNEAINSLKGFQRNRRNLESNNKYWNTSVNSRYICKRSFNQNVIV